MGGVVSCVVGCVVGSVVGSVVDSVTGGAGGGFWLVIVPVEVTVTVLLAPLNTTDVLVKSTPFLLVIQAV